MVSGVVVVPAVLIDTAPRLALPAVMFKTGDVPVTVRSVTLVPAVVLVKTTVLPWAVALAKPVSVAPPAGAVYVRPPKLRVSPAFMATNVTVVDSVVAGDAAPGVVTIKCPVPLDWVRSLTLSVEVAPETITVAPSDKPVAKPVKLPV